MSHALRDPVDDRYVPGHGDERYGVSAYDLDLLYVPETNRLTGTARVSVRAEKRLPDLVLDLHHRLRVDKVLVAGRKPARFAHKRDHLVVTLREPLAPGDEVELRVGYSGAPRPMSGLDGEAGWEELTDGSIVASQPHGAPSWFPCNDRPSDKASYRFEVTVPTGYSVVANGVPGGSRRSASTVTFTFDQAEPMATYLASVHVGRVAVHDEPDAPVHVVSSRERADQARHALRRQPEMLALFEDRFGPYPFAAGYTTVVTDDDLEIPLEAQALSIFGANFMTDEWDAQRLVAHELSHQWFGNSLTLQRWNDIWLHEGFACYAEWLWSEHAGGRTADAWARHHHARLAQLSQDLVLADPGPDLMFDDRVYKRGALAVHALRLTLGDDAFFDLLRDWTDRFRHGSVRTVDLEDLVSERTDHDGADLLGPWLRRPELPDLPPATS